MVSAGVTFAAGNTLDFGVIRAADTMASNPPWHVAGLLSLLARLGHEPGIVKRLLPHF